MRFQRFWIPVAVLAALAGCAANEAGVGDDDALKSEIEEALNQTKKPSSEATGETRNDRATGASYQIVSFGDLNGWEQDDHAAALVAFRASCDKIRRLASTETLGGLASHISDWKPSCDAADTVRADAAKSFFELAFQPVRMAPGKSALITAYYEPELPARHTADAKYRYPLYRKPNEVVARGGKYGVVAQGAVKPYLTRGEIDKGALEGRGLEIAYLSDPVDVFFLHVQGSGRLRYEDGSVKRVAFAAKNGHSYSSVGLAMVEDGILPRSKANADGIRDYVRANPAKGQEYLARNRSYIFFREVGHLDAAGGPEGALGVQLTDGRSIAVDRRYTSLGAPVWLDAENSPTGPIHRLVVAQDTGSAITGAQRADLFWGSGEQAGSIAGRMKHKGLLTVLLPTATVQRLTDSSS